MDTMLDFCFKRKCYFLITTYSNNYFWKLVLNLFEFILFHRYNDLPFRENLKPSFFLPIIILNTLYIIYYKLFSLLSLQHLLSFIDLILKNQTEVE